MSYVTMEGITRFYRESNVLANNHVDFELRENEIHALVGENGAGKTTLMKILYGLEKADSGRIFIKNEEVAMHTPLDAQKYGVGMVHQHFKLIPEFTVAENIIIGMEPRTKMLFLDKSRMLDVVKEIMDRFGFDLNPKEKIRKLSIGEKQQVALIRMLYRNDTILILDEPTSVLTGRQIDNLFMILKKLIRAGKTIIIITHKLNEVLSIADRITVMRKGRVTGTYRNGEVDKSELSKIIFDREIHTYNNLSNNQSIFHNEINSGKAVFKLEKVSIQSPGTEKLLLDDISFAVHTGEIVGITGAAGNGLTELEDVVSGLLKVNSGRIYYNGEDVTSVSIRGLRKRGFSYVPSDRMGRGSSLEATVAQNLIVINKKTFSPFGLLRNKTINTFVNKKLAQYSIGGEGNLPLHFLSGGNIQKTVLARELSIQTDFIIFSEPTWGLDSASSEYVYEKMLIHRKSGKAVILFSSQLDEILGLSDTVFVLYHGKITGRFLNNGKLTKESLGEYMLGLKHDG